MWTGPTPSPIDHLEHVWIGGATNPYSTWTGYFSNQAANNYQTVGGSWEILTPISNTGYTASGSPIGGYYGQEFLVMATPRA